MLWVDRGVDGGIVSVDDESLVGRPSPLASMTFQLLAGLASRSAPAGSVGSGADPLGASGDPRRFLAVPAGPHRVAVRNQATTVDLDLVVEPSRSYHIERKTSEHTTLALVVREDESGEVVLDTEPALEHARSALLDDPSLVPLAWFRDGDYALVRYASADGGEVLDQRYGSFDGHAPGILPAAVDLIEHLRSRGAIDARIVERSAGSLVLAWSGTGDAGSGISVLRSGLAGLHVLSFRRSGALVGDEGEHWSERLATTELTANEVARR